MSTVDEIMAAEGVSRRTAQRRLKGVQSRKQLDFVPPEEWLAPEGQSDDPACLVELLKAAGYNIFWDGGDECLVISEGIPSLTPSPPFLKGCAAALAGELETSNPYGTRALYPARLWQGHEVREIPHLGKEGAFKNEDAATEWRNGWKLATERWVSPLDPSYPAQRYQRGPAKPKIKPRPLGLPLKSKPVLIIDHERGYIIQTQRGVRLDSIHGVFFVLGWQRNFRSVPLRIWLKPKPILVLDRERGKLVQSFHNWRQEYAYGGADQWHDPDSSRGGPEVYPVYARVVEHAEYTVKEYRARVVPHSYALARPGFEYQEQLYVSYPHAVVLQAVTVDWAHLQAYLPPKHYDPLWKPQQEFLAARRRATIPHNHEIIADWCKLSKYSALAYQADQDGQLLSRAELKRLGKLHEYTAWDFEPRNKILKDEEQQERKEELKRQREEHEAIAASLSVWDPVAMDFRDPTTTKEVVTEISKWTDWGIYKKEEESVAAGVSFHGVEWVMPATLDAIRNAEDVVVGAKAIRREITYTPLPDTDAFRPCFNCKAALKKCNRCSETPAKLPFAAQ